jgi:putative drug exporter of the RND superfamily
VLNRQFGGGATTAQIVIDAPDTRDPRVQAAAHVLHLALEADQFYGHWHYEENAAHTLLVLTVATRGDSSSPEARAALQRLRGEVIPRIFGSMDARVFVTGATAFMVDEVAETTAYMPVVFGFVLAFSFVLLMVVFRSLVIPVKAVAMNLLSVGAAYGAIVLVFQMGVGADLFGFQRLPVIESWLPLFLFSVLFGLSMDYHVFLLSRIKERWDETGDNAGSVEYGLRSTGSIITGAAAIMVAVFGGFALGDLAMFQQMGFGLAVAVILDATIIRSVLVPASMQLLGDRNWYFPRWLEWLPRLDIEGAPRASVPAYAEHSLAFADGGD